MTRTFYSLAVFTAALHTVLAFVQAVVYFLLGQMSYALNIFFQWYVIYHVIIFFGSFVFLFYFRHKGYNLPFWTLVASLIASLFPLVVFIAVSIGKREWLNLYMPAEVTVLVTSVAIGLALLISEARKQFWLKLSGIVTLIEAVAMLALASWYLGAPSPDRAATLEALARWLMLPGFLGPLFLTINFAQEQKQLHPGEPTTHATTGENWVNGIKVVAMVTTLLIVMNLAVQTASRLSFEKDLAYKTKHWDTVPGGRTFVGSSGDTLKYISIAPENIDSSKMYPMVVCLPYGGGIDGAPPAKFLLEEANRKKYPSYLFVPFCPNGIGWGGIPNYPTMDTLVFEAIEAIEKEIVTIDADRVYISGVSRGGYGSWHFIELRPDLFAAAMPVCGAGDTTMAGNVVDVAIWAFHGEDDHNVPVRGSRDMIAAIKKSGGNPKYTEFEGAGHDIWNFVINTPGSFDWLFEQKRKKAQPATNL